MSVQDLVVQDAFRIELVAKLIRQVGRRRFRIGVRAVALCVRSMAFLAFRGEDAPAFLDNVDRRLQWTLLLFPAGGDVPPRVLSVRGTRRDDRTRPSQNCRVSS